MKSNNMYSIPRVRLTLLLSTAVLIGILGTLGALGATGMLTLTSRQALVHDRGGAVMPFDLNTTMHVFESTETGGVETVTANNADDSEQIALIQQHLQHETMRFRAGDFGDPAAIHGADMPGLAELRAGAAAIAFRYTALPNGAQISYETNDPQLIDALHRWFAAQLLDHGHDAMGQ